MPLRPEWSTRPAGPPLFHRRLCFILGKGGTGRSTVAAALAVLAARTGRQTLLVELIEGGRLSELFRTADIRTDRPVPLGPDLHGLRIDVERATEEYLADQLHVRPLVELMVRSRAFHAFAQAAPGLPEIITIGKIWTLAVALRRDGEGPEWDAVVVDCPATGHGLALLETAGRIRELAESGPIRDQAARIEEVVRHPAATGVAVVARPEELPVSEAVDTVAALRRGGLPAAVAVMNAVTPPRFSEADAAALAAARAAIDGRPDDGAGVALSAALDHRRQEAAEAAMIERLAASVDVPVVELPRIAAPVIDLEAVGRLADALAENGEEAIDPRPVEAEHVS